MSKYEVFEGIFWEIWFAEAKNVQEELKFYAVLLHFAKCCDLRIKVQQLAGSDCQVGAGRQVWQCD